MKELKDCPLCGSVHFKKELLVRDFSVSKENFSIVRCENCRLLFTNPRPSNEDIGEYYKSESYISHTNQSSGLVGNLYQFLRKKAILKKLSWIKKYSAGKTILDYGSGTGEFLNFCLENGWDGCGVEIADEPRNLSIENYNLNVIAPNQFNELESVSFDVVTMWHVLEHLDDLNGSIEKVSSVIKRNGLLVLALPNPESWDAKHYREHWAAWDVPIHYYHFSKNNVERLASSAGFKLEEVINMPFDAYYISLISEEYKTGRKNWLKAVWNGLKSNIYAGNNNASSLTYILRKQ